MQDRKSTGLIYKHKTLIHHSTLIKYKQNSLFFLFLSFLYFFFIILMQSLYETYSSQQQDPQPSYMLPPAEELISYPQYEQHSYRSTNAYSETRPHEEHDPCLTLPAQSWSSSIWRQVPRGPKKKSLPSQSKPDLPSPMTRPKLTTTVWEDEGTLCYQVDAKSVCVARRQDNDMINGTKLLNVVGMSRGKRDGILKNERGRIVVKVGAMHLKGVWITFARAKDLAAKFKISELLYPLFVNDPSEFLTAPPPHMMSVPSNTTSTSPRNQLQSWEKNNAYHQSLPSITSQPDQLYVRSSQQSGSCSPDNNNNNTGVYLPDTIRYHSYAYPYPLYPNENDHHFSSSYHHPYAQQQRKSSIPAIRDEPFDERRHSFHLPSSPPPESTNMKFAFSSPTTSSWTDSTTLSSPQLVRNDLAGPQDHKGKKRSRESPLLPTAKIIKIKHEH